MTDKPSNRSPARVLVIDDEAIVCLSCVQILAPAGHQVDTRQSATDGLEAALAGGYDLVLLDMVMPGMDGLEVLRRLKGSSVPAEVVIITGYSTVQNAVQAMKAGAADYVAKPFSPDELSIVVDRVLERSALVRENAALRAQLAAEDGFQGVLGRSRGMQDVFALLRRVATTDCTSLLVGEKGTGKEMAAAAVHHMSPRRVQPFISFDCTTVPATGMESELFGHLKGAFAGAGSSKQGLIEVANRGTLYLAGVDVLSLETQGKLLRLLENRVVRALGDTQDREVDVRLLASCTADLAPAVAEGRFREDLYLRLNVVPVVLPPLRERQGDIPLLATTFLERFGRSRTNKVVGFTPEAMSLMEAHPWPGNVRELKHVVERLVVLCDTERVEPRHLPRELQMATPLPTTGPLPESWEDFKRLKRQVHENVVDSLERRFLQEALQRAGGNVTRAAEEVQMQRTNFHALMRKHGLGVAGEG